jgi:hypothetical protein
VRCGECGTEGPARTEPETAAIEAWNTRRAPDLETARRVAERAFELEKNSNTETEAIDRAIAEETAREKDQTRR